VLDGIVDTVYYGGFTRATRYHRVRHIQNDTALKVMGYGSANGDSESNTRSVVMLLNVWTNGADGLLPWQTVGSDAALDNGDPRGGGNALIVPGKRFGISVVGDMRLKALREGQQLIEYMKILADRYELEREQVKAMVHQAINIKAGQKAGTSADNADAMQFNTLKAWQISELRRTLVELIVQREQVKTSNLPKTIGQEAVPHQNLQAPQARDKTSDSESSQPAAKPPLPTQPQPPRSTAL
jgi:hypothetical protein